MLQELCYNATNSPTGGRSTLEHKMAAIKLSISLPETQVSFIDQYQSEHDFKSRSEVIREALCMLRINQLEQAYRDASAEIDADFDITTADGIDEYETW